jgi:hypothetical protein
MMWQVRQLNLRQLPPDWVAHEPGPAGALTSGRAVDTSLWSLGPDMTGNLYVSSCVIIHCACYCSWDAPGNLGAFRLMSSACALLALFMR